MASSEFPPFICMILKLVQFFCVQNPFSSGIQQHPPAVTIHAVHQTATLGGLRHAGSPCCSCLRCPKRHRKQQLRVKNSGCSLEALDNSMIFYGSENFYGLCVKPKHHRSPSSSIVTILEIQWPMVSVTELRSSKSDERSC